MNTSLTGRQPARVYIEVRDCYVTVRTNKELVALPVFDSPDVAQAAAADISKKVANLSPETLQTWIGFIPSFSSCVRV